MVGEVITYPLEFFKNGLNVVLIQTWCFSPTFNKGFSRHKVSVFDF